MWYTILPKLLNMSITGGIIIVLVLLARLLLRRVSKKFSYALWVIVLFRLLCPVSLSSAFSVFNMMDTPLSSSGSMEYIPENIVHTENLAVTIPLSDISEAINTLPQGDEKPDVDLLELSVSVATYLWAFGAIALLGYSIVKLFLLKRKLIGAIPLQNNIYLADHITTPFVIGLFCPKIYLPSTLDEKERGYIIQHEQHHIRRFDYVVKILAFLSLCIHWFNPLVWVAFVISGNDMEMSCDEAVMKRMGSDVRADYSKSLLSLATSHRIISGTPLAFGEGDTKGRIKNVLNYKKPMVWVTVVAVIAILVLAVCFISNPTQKFQTAEITDTSELTLTETAWYEENSQTTLVSAEVEYSKVENDPMNIDGGNVTLETEKNLELAPIVTAVSQTDINELMRRYVSDLPRLDATYEMNYTQDGRQFNMEDSIDNEAEMLVYRNYFDEITADFADYESLIGDNESLDILIQNTKRNFDEGIYMQSYTIHTMITLTASDMENLRTKNMLDVLNGFGITRYVFVAADVSWEYNEAWLARGPQLDEGRYMRYYLIGCTDKDTNWKIYDVYWDDFLVS